MTTPQILMLAGVAVYFSIGAFIAYGITAMSVGFTGRFEPMAVAVFFGWPLFYLLQTSGFVFALPWIFGVCAMTGCAYYLIRTFQ